MLEALVEKILSSTKYAQFLVKSMCESIPEEEVKKAEEIAIELVDWLQEKTDGDLPKSLLVSMKLGNAMVAFAVKQSKEVILKAFENGNFEVKAVSSEDLSGLEELIDRISSLKNKAAEKASAEVMH